MIAEALVALAQRLKQLRTDRGITQDQLAKAMGVSVPLVSSWENTNRPTLPPVSRLKSYADLFASARSADKHRWRPVRRTELTEEENIRRQDLEEDLLELRAIAIGGAQSPAPVSASVSMANGPWRFPAEQDITIVCARLPETMRRTMTYADPSNPDYAMLYNYADLDSLVEVHGHIRAANPDSQVRFKLATDLVKDDYTTHLVLIGGVDWNLATQRTLLALRLPIRQMSRDDLTDEGVFAVSEGGSVIDFAPRFETTPETAAGKGKTLLEDVAQFVRGPNPFNRRRTVTICNGMYGQGTYGAIRALTDARFRDRNGAHVSTRFPEGKTYSLLFRVAIVESMAVTPDWTAPGTVLHEWSEATE
jgi:transcriptional regulator with XRE-family HTH domain